jgi:UDP-glucuronate 4-epimerase
LAVIVTGAAGFIGMHLCDRLLERGERVIGVDNFNAYYDVRLKEARAARLIGRPGFDMARIDVADARAFEMLVSQAAPKRVLHLAAQAGVRYSRDNPFAYERTNVAGHLSVLEACRHSPTVRHLVYASSSSVYGDRPLGGAGFREDDALAAPASLYAATKRAGELMSQTYAQLYGIGQTGLRFFTVYGPWGRPDMAYFGFTQKILAGEPIEVFGEGKMARDFTYIDDIVDGILGVLDHPPADGEHRLFNIGDSRPVGLMDMIRLLEENLGREATKRFRPMQPGDVTATFADISQLKALCGYNPKVTLEAGLPKFVEWYQAFRRDSADQRSPL